jgi:hypothetical protein
MVWFRKCLILIHRYMGIVLGLPFLVWFISGIGMMYAKGMPQLTPELRLERLTPLDLSGVRLTVLEAAQKAALQFSPGGAVLLTVMERPAYRLGGSTVFADNGELLAGVSPGEAQTIAARFMNLPESRVRHLDTIEEADQWTIAERGLMPLYKIAVDDADRTELYVSPDSAEIVVLTTSATRALAWVAAIPHWLYFTKLRVNDDLWRQVVLWMSGLGSILALLGIVLGIIQFKPSRPFKVSRLSSYIPYSGWMRWHYISGVIFGVLTLTWVFSGMLSMEPWGWASSGGAEIRQEAFTGGALDLSQFGAIEPAAWQSVLGEKAIKEIEFVRIQGDAYYIVHGSEGKPVLLKANPLQPRRERFSLESLMDRVREATPGTPIVESMLLTEYDSYYYSADFAAPLPVLRVKFGDPDETWIYIDPEMGQLVGGVHRLDRVERWIYNGFHSLDFSFWYYNRPLWELGVIVLSLGGAAVSGIGLIVGVKRVWRGLRRIVRSVLLMFPSGRPAIRN